MYSVREIKITGYDNIHPNGDKVSSSKRIYELAKPLFDDVMEVRERFIAFYLNRNNKVIGYFMMSKSGISGTVVDVKLLFSVALKSLASGIILVHNHPSGNIKESEHDRQITNKIKDGCSVFDIQLIDHLIISHYGFRSFSDVRIL